MKPYENFFSHGNKVKIKSCLIAIFIVSAFLVQKSYAKDENHRVDAQPARLDENDPVSYLAGHTLLIENLVVPPLNGHEDGIVRYDYYNTVFTNFNDDNAIAERAYHRGGCTVVFRSKQWVTLHGQVKVELSNYRFEIGSPVKSSGLPIESRPKEWGYDWPYYNLPSADPNGLIESITCFRPMIKETPALAKKSHGAFNISEVRDQLKNTLEAQIE